LAYGIHPACLAGTRLLASIPLDAPVRASRAVARIDSVPDHPGLSLLSPAIPTPSTAFVVIDRRAF